MLPYEICRDCTPYPTSRSIMGLKSLTPTRRVAQGLPVKGDNRSMAKTRLSRGMLSGLLTLLLMAAPVAGKMTYTLSFEERAEHYITVELNVDGLRNKEYLDFKMAVWTPGSYRIRDYSRNVQDFTVRSGRRSLPVIKLDKHTWRVQLDGQRQVIARYKVYAFEPSVRTSFVDTDEAIINGASVFVYPVGMESQEPLVVINKPVNWQEVTSGMDWVGGRSPVFRASNIDDLIDSPIMAGDHTVLDFQVNNVPHRYAISGTGNYDPERLLTDTGNIIQEIHNIFGEVPYDNYTIFLQIRDNNYGGLEHLNSTHLLYPRWDFSPGRKYRRYLELVAHEVFHTYNVKRIRPEPLGPFDYDRENYTTLLWVAEGLTAYYDRLLLRRADLLEVEDYFELLAGDINKLEATPGHLIQTLQEASFDTWIKHYRPNENSPNATISYYLKGSLVGLALDLAIQEATDGERGLDDVFRILWRNYRDVDKGLTDEGFRLVSESVAGRPLDDVFTYVTTTEEIDWEPILAPFGLQVVRSYTDPTDSSKAYYGFETLEDDGRWVISRMNHQTPAVTAGLSVHDELISIDGFRLLGDAAKDILASRAQGKVATLIINRDGRVRAIKIRPGKPPFDQVSLVPVASPSEQQRKLYTGWLETPLD